MTTEQNRLSDGKLVALSSWSRLALAHAIASAAHRGLVDDDPAPFVVVVPTNQLERAGGIWRGLASEDVVTMEVLPAVLTTDISVLLFTRKEAPLCRPR